MPVHDWPQYLLWNWSSQIALLQSHDRADNDDNSRFQLAVHVKLVSMAFKK